MRSDTTRNFYPVIWAPDHACHGAAATSRRALALVRNVPILACEHVTATLREDLDGRLTWFCGPVLTSSHRPGRKA